MQDVLELRRRFLGAIASQAPQIVHDLFERNDSKDWAARWGFLSEWIIEKAERALECRTGNRDQAHALRRQWTANQAGNRACTLLWFAVIIGTRDARFQMMITPALRLRGMVNEEGELRAWRKASGFPAKPPALELKINVFDDDEDFHVRPSGETGKKLFKIEVFDKGEDFHYLTEEELFERICSDPRIRQAVAEYHRAIFHDHPIFGCFRDLEKIRSGQEEKHMKWLIAYIAGASDGEIAAGEETLDADTVRLGRTRLAKRIGLELKSRQGVRRSNRTRRPRK